MTQYAQNYSSQQNYSDLASVQTYLRELKFEIIHVSWAIYMLESCSNAVSPCFHVLSDAGQCRNLRKLFAQQRACKHLGGREKKFHIQKKNLFDHLNHIQTHDALPLPSELYHE